MMINTPSAPGGAAAAPSALPGVAMGDAAFASTPAPAEGTAAPAPEAIPALVPFAQLLDFAGLAVRGEGAGTSTAAAGEQPAGETAEAETTAEAAPVEGLAAMMPVLHLAVLPAAQPQAAATAATAGMAQAGIAATQARANTLLASASDTARQAAADAITAAGSAAAAPLAARLLQGALPAAGETLAAKGNGEARQAASTATTGTTAAPTQTASVAAATVLAAQDGAAQSGTDGQSGQQQGDNAGTFRGVMAAAAPAAGSAAPADTVKLVGNPDAWQQPLRAALGDRLQVTLQKGNDQAANMAVIRLEPPNLGSIEISIRQTAGALHVSMSASNSEVVRQLNAVGDSMRQDLSQRQYGDVAVTVSQASSRSLADSEGRGRQPEREAEQRGPGRALNEGDDNNTTFAMLRE